MCVVSSYREIKVAQGNKRSTFFLSIESASLGATLVSCLIASLLAWGQDGGKGWKLQGRFQKKLGGNVRRSAAGSHMLSAEWRFPTSVSLKRLSASPMVDSCRAPEACVTWLSFGWAWGPHCSFGWVTGAAEVRCSACEVTARWDDQRAS